MNSTGFAVAVTIASAVAFGCTSSRPTDDVEDRSEPPPMPSVVLRAARTLAVEDGTTVSGGAIAGDQVVVNGAQVESVHAASVRLESAVVLGGLFADEVDARRSEYGSRSDFAPGTLADLRPRPSVAPGDASLVVGPGDQVRLETSAGLVRIQESGTLVIDEGFYELESLVIEAGASVIVLEAARLAISERLLMGPRAYLGPPRDSGVALNLQVQVAGRDTRQAVAVEIGEGARIVADLIAPAGTFVMRKNSSAIGRFEAQDIGIATGVGIGGAGIGVAKPCQIFKCWGEAVAGGSINLQCGYVSLAPNIDNWLTSHSKVRDAIQWQHTVTGSPYEPQPQDMVAYANWTTAEKAKLAQSFETYWVAYCEGQPLLGDAALSFPPANVAGNIGNDTNKAHTVVTEQTMRALLMANIGHSLTLELGDYVPWSVLNDDADSLEIYFASLGHGRRSPNNEFSTGESGPLSYLQDWHVSHGRTTPSPPAWTFNFLTSNGLVGPTRHDTIVNLLNWSRANMIHFYGQHKFQRVEEVWQYRGHPPVRSVATGTTDLDSGNFERWTAGCHGTAGWYRAVLRAANIPVQIPLACDHAQIYFRSEGLYLDHGDNPYTGYTNATWPPEAALIDEATYVSWFGPNLDHQTTGCANIGRRPMELSQTP